MKGFKFSKINIKQSKFISGKKYKYYLLLSLKTLTITLSFLAVYYFANLAPKLLIPNALLNAEKVLSGNLVTLTENKIAYVELTRLNAGRGNFEIQKDEILGKLKKTNEEGLQKLDNPEKLKQLKGPPSDVKTFLNNELPKAYSKLIEKNKKVYTAQKNIIDQLDNFDSKVTKIFAYNPEMDLGKLDFQKEKDEALGRIANAKQGLTKIKEEVSKEDKENDSINNLSKEIDATTALLTQLEDSLKKGNYKDRQNVKTALYSQFGKVKDSALDAELSIIKSPESVKVLTDQTNLILEYQFWLKKINQF